MEGARALGEHSSVYSPTPLHVSCVMYGSLLTLSVHRQLENIVIRRGSSLEGGLLPNTLHKAEKICTAHKKRGQDGGYSSRPPPGITPVSLSCFPHW